VLPGSVGSVIAVIPPTIAFTIGAEALLSFLGAGLQLPDVSWGVLLAEAQRYIRQAPHLMLPGLFLLIVTGALVVVGEAARVRVPD
jgi:oligopeptide transport system permease protein